MSEALGTRDETGAAREPSVVEPVGAARAAWGKGAEHVVFPVRGRGER